MSQRKFKRALRKDAAPQAPQPQDAVQPSLQAMVWYRPEHWEELKALFVDGHLLPPTYDEWLKRAEAMKTEAQAAGDMVIKVFIDPETFPAWCKENGLETDSEARSRLAIEVAQAQSFSL